MDSSVIGGSIPHYAGVAVMYVQDIPGNRFPTFGRLFQKLFQRFSSLDNLVGVMRLRFNHRKITKNHVHSQGKIKTPMRKVSGR